MPTLPATVTLKGIWAALIALAIAVVLALLALQTVRLEGFKVWPLHWKGWIEVAHDAQDRAKQCNSNLAASNASIGLLQAAIDERNREIEQHAAEYAAAKKQADSAQAKLAEQARSSDQRIAQLRAMATKGGGECATPTDLAKLAEGL